MIRRLLRRWWVRWLVLPVAALLTAHAGWTLALKWEFERRIEELRAAGEPVELKDLCRPKPPDEDNAAPLWEEAHAWYQANLHIPAVLLTARPEEEWDEGDREAVAEYLGGGDPYIDLLARAAAKADMWQDLKWEKGWDMEVPVIGMAWDTHAYLRHRARYAERAPDALRLVAIMLDLAPKLECSTVIEAFVRWTFQHTAAEMLEEAARKPGFDAAAARALLDGRLASADDPGPLTEAFRGQRVLGLSTMRRWIDGDSLFRIAEERSGTSPDEIDWTTADTISASWLARPLAYREALLVLSLMEENLRLVDPPPREALTAAKRLDEEHRGGMLFRNIFGGLSVAAFKNRLRHQASIRIARVGLALLALKQETGDWPESLDAVVPLVGEKWVEDPYTGERLQYEPGVRLQAAVPVPEAFKDMPEEYEIVWRFGG